MTNQSIAHDNFFSQTFTYYQSYSACLFIFPSPFTASAHRVRISIHVYTMNTNFYQSIHNCFIVNQKLFNRISRYTCKSNIQPTDTVPNISCGRVQNTSKSTQIIREHSSYVCHYNNLLRSKTAMQRGLAFHTQTKLISKLMSN